MAGGNKSTNNDEGGQYNDTEQLERFDTFLRGRGCYGPITTNNMVLEGNTTHGQPAGLLSTSSSTKHKAALRRIPTTPQTSYNPNLKSRAQSLNLVTRDKRKRGGQATRRNWNEPDLRDILIKAVEEYKGLQLNMKEFAIIKGIPPTVFRRRYRGLISIDEKPSKRSRESKSKQFKRIKTIPVERYEDARKDYSPLSFRTTMWSENQPKPKVRYHCDVGVLRKYEYDVKSQAQKIVFNNSDR